MSCIKKTAVSLKYSLIKFRSYDTIPPPPPPPASNRTEKATFKI